MKKKLGMTFAILLLATSIAQAKDPNVKAYCDNKWQQGTPGLVNISSEHGFTIINNYPIAMTYHIEFDNAVQYGKLREIPLDYSEPPYTPNAHLEYDLKLEAGKTYHYGAVSINKDAYFFKRGRYKSSATTTIKLNGVVLDQCVHETNVDIN
jgi:hypothetical protein